MAPLTRTSLTPGRARQVSNSRASWRSIAATCSRRGSRSNRSSEALAAAQASGLPMKVGPCINAADGSSARKAPNTLRLATVAASASVPPVSALDNVTMSGTTPASSMANIRPVRPKPVKISSKISSSPWRSARSRKRRSAAASWKIMRRQGAREGAVHALFRVAHRHRTQRVAVIGRLEADELAASGRAAIDPILQRHLERDLDRDRAGIGKEHMIEIVRQQARETAREIFRRRMRQAGQHDMRHDVELARDFGPDMRMVVAVAGRPPRRDAVDQHPSVGKVDAAALGALDGKRGGFGAHLRIGPPKIAAGTIDAG